jgi:hypothetical protein
MKTIRTGAGRGAFALLALVGALTACGGGGDDDAGAGALTLSMSAIDLKGGSTTTCYSGFAYRVFVFGGAAPYKVMTDVPDALLFSTAEVGDRGGSFDVTANGVCFNKGGIIVTDKLNNRVVLPVTNVFGTT